MQRPVPALAVVFVLLAAGCALPPATVRIEQWSQPVGKAKAIEVDQNRIVVSRLSDWSDETPVLWERSVTAAEFEQILEWLRKNPPQAFEDEYWRGADGWQLNVSLFYPGNTRSKRVFIANTLVPAIEQLTLIIDRMLPEGHQVNYAKSIHAIEQDWKRGADKARRMWQSEPVK